MLLKYQVRKGGHHFTGQSGILGKHGIATYVLTAMSDFYKLHITG